MSQISPEEKARIQEETRIRTREEANENLKVRARWMMGSLIIILLCFLAFTIVSFFYLFY